MKQGSTANATISSKPKKGAVLKTRSLKAPKEPQSALAGLQQLEPAPEISAVAKLQLRSVLHAVKAVRAGDFSVRVPIDSEGTIAEIGEVLNDIIAINEEMAT